MKQLSGKDLRFILICKNFHALNNYFSAEPSILLREDFSDDFSYLRLQQNYPGSRALMSAIEMSSILIDSYWFLVSFIDLGDAAKGLALAAVIIAFFVGIGCFVYSKQQLVYQSNHQYHQIQLSLLKNLAVKELIQRQGKNYNPEQDFKGQNNTFPVSKMNSVILTFEIAVILFATYFWGIQDCLDILGYEKGAEMMASPGGMTIMAAATVSLCLFFGYIDYLARSNENIRVEQRERIEIETNYLLANNTIFFSPQTKPENPLLGSNVTTSYLFP